MRLLICDSHVLLADTLATLMAGEGHDVRVTTRPGSVLGEVEGWQPELVLIDVGSARGEAIDVVAQVVTRHPEVRVVVLSACREPAVVAAALDGGARGYLGKHVDVTALVRAVERVLAGERVLDPDTGRDVAGSHAGADPDEQSDDVAWLLGFLTPKEHEVLRRIVVGESTREMAESMHVSRSTARTHVQNVLSKLGVHSRLEAAAVVSRARAGTPGAPVLARSG